MFFVQLILFYILSVEFDTLAHNSISGDIVSKAAVTLFCFLLVGLSPIAAILKRHPTRLRNPGFDEEIRWLSSGLKKTAVISYALSQFLFWLAGTFLLIEVWEDLFGRFNSGSLFLPLFLLLPLMTALNTFIFAFYFFPVARPPLFAFLAAPQSALLGDLCLFLNMILFQMYWGYMMTELARDKEGLFMRLLILCLTALLIYFPPRLFYLAEHVKDKKVWLLMLLANTPMIFRIMLGF